jgi:hypothetical protein
MSFKIAQVDDCERAGSWQLVRRTLSSHAPRSSGFEPMDWT